MNRKSNIIYELRKEIHNQPCAAHNDKAFGKAVPGFRLYGHARAEGVRYDVRAGYAARPDVFFEPFGVVAYRPCFDERSRPAEAGKIGGENFKPGRGQEINLIVKTRSIRHVAVEQENVSIPFAAHIVADKSAVDENGLYLRYMMRATRVYDSDRCMTRASSPSE